MYEKSEAHVFRMGTSFTAAPSPVLQKARGDDLVLDLNRIIALGLCRTVRIGTVSI